MAINKMKNTPVSFIFISIVTITGCNILKESPKFKLQDGFYKSRVDGFKKVKIYVDNTDTSINVYLAEKNKKFIDFDSMPASALSLPRQFLQTGLKPNTFNKTTFDIDFLTLPFKYRPAKNNLPRQFTTTLNGAVYLGFRNDIFKVGYERSPRIIFERKTDHYGFSYGVFTGLGGTVMNPSTANGQIIYEYDGVVWTKGIAGIMAVNNFTVGLALGMDGLLDKNHQWWNYQQKPWIGLALGLNLN